MANGQEDKRFGTRINVANLVATILSVVVLGVLSYVGRNIVDKQESMSVRLQENTLRITRIESNRYTSADALSDHRMVANEINELRKWVEDNFPPPWLREQMSELKAEIRKLKEEMRGRD